VSIGKRWYKDLDIPYTKKHGTPDDYEASWKQKRIQFCDQIRCIAFQFHVDTFFSMDDQEKKDTTFKLLRRGMDKLISENVGI
jgi:hypothetical protein